MLRLIKKCPKRKKENIEKFPRYSSYTDCMDTITTNYSLIYSSNCNLTADLTLQSTKGKRSTPMEIFLSGPDCSKAD